MLVLAQTCVEWSCFLFSAENKLAQVSSASRLVQVSCISYVTSACAMVGLLNRQLELEENNYFAVT